MISLDLIYDTDLSKIEISQDQQYLQATWLKHPNREEFKTETLIFSKYILAHQVNKVLVDVRKRFYQDMGDQIADQRWLEGEILPLFKHLKQVRCVYLVTQNSYETMYENQAHGLILDRYELFKHMEVGVFVEVEEAQDWLLNY